MLTLETIQTFYNEVANAIDNTVAQAVTSDYFKFLQTPDAYSSQQRTYLIAKIEFLYNAGLFSAEFEKQIRDISQDINDGAKVFAELLAKDDINKETFLLKLQGIQFEDESITVVPSSGHKLFTDHPSKKPIDPIITRLAFARKNFDQKVYDQACIAYYSIIEDLKQSDNSNLISRRADIEFMLAESHYAHATQMLQLPKKQQPRAEIIQNMLKAIQIWETKSFSELIQHHKDLDWHYAELSQLYSRVKMHDFAFKYGLKAIEYLNQHYPIQILLNSLEKPDSIKWLKQHYCRRVELGTAYQAAGNHNNAQNFFLESIDIIQQGLAKSAGKIDKPQQQKYLNLLSPSITGYIESVMTKSKNTFDKKDYLKMISILEDVSDRLTANMLETILHNLDELRRKYSTNPFSLAYLDQARTYFSDLRKNLGQEYIQTQSHFAVSRKSSKEEVEDEFTPAAKRIRNTNNNSG